MRYRDLLIVLSAAAAIPCAGCGTASSLLYDFREPGYHSYRFCEAPPGPYSGTWIDFCYSFFGLLSANPWGLGIGFLHFVDLPLSAGLDTVLLPVTIPWSIHRNRPREAHCAPVEDLSRPALNALLEALESPHEHVRRTAANGLVAFGPEAREAIPLLIAMLRETGGRKRSPVGGVLGSIGPAAIPALVSALTDDDQFVRSQAAKALGAMKEAAEPAIPVLILALRTDDGNVRREISLALAHIGPPAVAPLMDALGHEHARVRGGAADAIGRMWDFRAQASAALPALIKALSDEDWGVRSSAARALRIMGKRSPEAVSALTAALEDDDQFVRSAAATTLGGFGTAAREAIPALCKAVHDSESIVRHDAVRALGNIGATAEPALPVLDELGRTGNHSERSAARWAANRIRSLLPTPAPW